MVAQLVGRWVLSCDWGERKANVKQAVSEEFFVKEEAEQRGAGKGSDERNVCIDWTVSKTYA